MRWRTKITKGRVLAGLCLLSLLLMFLPARWSRWPCQVVRPVLVPLDYPGMAVTRHLRQRAGQLTRRTDPVQEAALEALRKCVFDQQQMLQRQSKEMEKLAGWRSVLGTFPCGLVQASVVYGEPLPLRQRRLLDAGRRQGVSSGDLVTTRRIVHPLPVALPEKLAVLGENYVVGQIADCGSHTATLQLLTDPTFKMPAKLWRMLQPGEQRTFYVPRSGGGLEQRTFRHDGRTPAGQSVGERIEVQATGDGRQIVLVQVPAHHGVRPGDLLTTSDSAGLLPFGLTLGRVRQVQPDKQAPHYVTVLADPLADLSLLQEVYIVLPYGRPGG